MALCVAFNFERVFSFELTGMSTFDERSMIHNLEHPRDYVYRNLTDSRPVRIAIDSIRHRAERPTEGNASTVCWLHVSDFHFSAQSGSDSDIVLDALLGTLEDFRRHGRSVDLVFLTGDLAFSGDPMQYNRAEDYLSRLCQVLDLDRIAVHLVPGNHDVNRGANKGLLRTITYPTTALSYFEPQASRHHLAKFEAFRQFYDRFYSGARQAAPGQATALGEIVRVRDVMIGILPLNTAWFAQDEHDSGKLLVGEPMVRAGLSAIAASDLKVALMHHPFSDLADVERTMVQQRLYGGCHFILRGHLHETEMSAISTGTSMLWYRPRCLVPGTFTIPKPRPLGRCGDRQAAAVAGGATLPDPIRADRPRPLDPGYLHVPALLSNLLKAAKHPLEEQVEACHLRTQPWGTNPRSSEKGYPKRPRRFFSPTGDGRTGSFSFQLTEYAFCCW